MSTNLGRGENGGRLSEFGAEQVILVRNAEAKDRLEAEIGATALVLTILQSKGMEFDDVVLWNFFTESSSPAGFRQLRELLHDNAGSFDTIKHAVSS